MALTRQRRFSLPSSALKSPPTIHFPLSTMAQHCSASYTIRDFFAQEIESIFFFNSNYYYYQLHQIVRFTTLFAGEFVRKERNWIIFYYYSKLHEIVRFMTFFLNYCYLSFILIIKKFNYLLLLLIIIIISYMK